MTAKLIMLFNDTPRFGFATAVIRDDETEKYTTIIVNESKLANLIIQPLEDALISFGNSRRTVIQDLEFISHDDRKHKDFSKFADGDVFTAPAVFRTQPSMSIKDGKLQIWTRDIDTGWARPIDAAHFSSQEIITAKHTVDGSQQRAKAYLIEMPPFTLIALELGFHQFCHYYASFWNSKEFFIGTELYSRTLDGKFALTDGQEPTPDVCKPIRNVKMHEYLASRGVI